MAVWAIASTTSSILAVVSGIGDAAAATFGSRGAMEGTSVAFSKSALASIGDCVFHSNFSLRRWVGPVGALGIVSSGGSSESLANKSKISGPLGNDLLLQGRRVEASEVAHDRGESDCDLLECGEVDNNVVGTMGFAYTAKDFGRSAMAANTSGWTVAGDAPSAAAVVKHDFTVAMTRSYGTKACGDAASIWANRRLTPGHRDSRN